MYLKYSFLAVFFLLFYGVVNSFAQASKPQKIDLVWGNDVDLTSEGLQGQSMMQFEGAQYDGSANSFPYYVKRIPNPFLGFKAVASIANAVYQDLETGSRVDWSKVQQQPVVTSDVLYEKKQEYLAISILPFRIDVTGRKQKLISFELQYAQGENLFKSSARFGSVTSSNSVLASGNWVKIAVSQTGIHKITSNQLAQFGLDPSQTDPNQIRLFGNGGGMLPRLNSKFRYDDLAENAIEVYDGGTPGRFDDGDYILFYGEAPTSWSLDANTGKFVHELNLLSDYTYYFLTPQISLSTPPKRIISRASSAQLPNNNVTDFDDRQYHEVERVNFIKSGRQWYGEQFDVDLTQSFNFSFPNIDLTTPVHVKSNLIARSFSPSYFRMNYNGQTILQQNVPAVGTSYTSDFADENISSVTLNPTGADVNLSLTYFPTTSTSVGYLNSLIVNARRSLVMTGSQISFRNIASATPGKVSQFTITGALNNVRIWDVTDPTNVVQQLTDAPGDFVVATDSLLEFLAFNGTSFNSPTYAGRVSNQNLHGLGAVDMVIITHPDFESEASRLADFHRNENNLRVALVRPQEIYNEFSSGAADLVAIRDFMRMFYNRATNPADLPKYLLLFGDGSYDNKGSGESNTNFIPTYQSLNSISLIRSYVSDDFFGFLDDQEGDWDDTFTDLLDVAVGRFPVKNLSEARIVVNKTIDYATPGIVSDATSLSTCSESSTTSLGDWRNVICFIADDEDSGLHLNQSNGLATYVRNNHPEFNIDKIFIDSYNQVSTPGGQRYPSVNEAISRRVDKGALVINYTGHGGETGWTAERILDNTMVRSWKNKRKLPLFITATCEFSRYDDPGRTSTGELVLIESEAGGVALMTTTRLVYAAQNGVLNSVMMNHLFDEINGEQQRLGDVYVTVKNDNSVLSGGINPRNFSLLGDPALQLCVPRYDVITTAINGNVPVANNDTLSALRKVTISGEVRQNGQKLSGFNGIVYPTVFDKEEIVSTLGNDPSSPVINFSLRKNAVYRGKASVNNGEFSFTFVVPRDIAYNIGRGRISYYAHNGVEDATGNYDSVMVGGFFANGNVDSEGPQVKLFLNDEKFVYGGYTDENPVILALVADSNGVNTVGNGVGHDITATIDNDPNRIFTLNDYYESDLDDYTKGRVVYPLNGLVDGKHTLKFKVWDIYNNSSEVTTEFTVAESAKLALERVLNYPNPFTTRTSFFFEHNRPCGDLDVQIQIFTVSGRLIKTINRAISCEGYRYDGMEWDGRDEFGDPIGRGVYVYRLKIRDESGSVADKYEKLVVLK
ncbi:MAG: type IX secretion system sortase PorU [Bacteroidota bacterium]